jgi:hypothetical protein
MTLSQDDLNVLCDTRFFPARFRIAQELDQLLSRLKDALSDELKGWPLPVEGVDTSRGKIFRGENYRQFPYHLLDFPRRFDAKGIFAMRSLCRWGHEWSFTLHLQAEGLHPFREKLIGSREHLLKQDVWWCVNDTPWEYHFEEDNYRRLDDLSADDFLRRCRQGSFIKLSRQLPLERTAEVPEFGLKTFRLYRQCLS